MPNDQLYDRREILKGLVVAGTGAILTKTSDGIGVVLKHIYDQFRFRLRKSEVWHVADISQPLQIYAGTNQLARAEGKKELSQYLKTASAAFSKVVETSLGGKVTFNEVQPDDDLLKLDVEKELILLGGPVSNVLGGSVTGYRYKKLPNEILFPIFESNDFRWGYYCGDNEYGSYASTVEKAKRCEGGVIVERPLYAIIDNRSSSRLRRFKKDDNGFLQEEVLLITKTRNPFHDHFSMFTIGGMHGYSIQQFSREIEENLSKLQGKLRGATQYQIYIPVDLDHKDKKGVHVTEAFLNWTKAETELL